MAHTEPDQLDAERLAQCPQLARVVCLETVGSTQDYLHERVRGGDAGPLPLLVVSEEQTAGRGRGANRWWSARGSLAFSLLFDPTGWDLPRGPMPERSLAVGVAVVDTIAPLLSNLVLGLHWPNDVFAAGKKLAGVLIDVLPDGNHIVGIGLNVNNSLAGAPDDVRARATSLCELADRAFDRTAVLLHLLEQLERALRGSAAAPEQFGRRFDELCLQRGHDLTVEVGGESTTGRCAGIAPDGALLLDTLGGRQRFYSGVLRKEP
jgi:BirA family transcriptional regulator, biotin operon repressor / biotin---[acetyl-CoA-carboxylase] ligase